MPPDNPSKAVSILSAAELRQTVQDKGVVSLCRCFKSSTFPYCDGKHVSHNKACGDNTGPIVIKSLGKPPAERGLDKLKVADFTPTLSAGAPGRANNYGVSRTDLLRAESQLSVSQATVAARAGAVEHAGGQAEQARGYGGHRRPRGRHATTQSLLIHILEIVLAVVVHLV